jgi:uncharacterized repeat protein (TIGR01451 family)
MRKSEVGQTFILVLILLAIGATMVVPTLGLTSTTLKSSQIVYRQSRGLYAAEAAQEYMLWKLKHTNFANTFTYDGEAQSFTFDACGVPVTATVIMRAVEGSVGLMLATDDVIRPTKTVMPNTAIDKFDSQTYEYTIELEQLSDNNTQGLDVIYDMLPKDFSEVDYEDYSSEMSVDDGPWQDVPDPSMDTVAGQVRLRWPASGSFTMDSGNVTNYFDGMRDFDVRQVKKLRFKVTGAFSTDDRKYCNWVVLKVGEVLTLSGPQASVTVGVPAKDLCEDQGLLAVEKTSDPAVIAPGVSSNITYTISMTNLDGSTRHIEEITDYLPPGFAYTENTTYGITTANPVVSLENVNGIDRDKLYWLFSGAGVSIAATENLTLSFAAYTTQEISGNYFNEVMVENDIPVPTIFSEIGVSDSDWNGNYSWNAGGVMVPAYDTETGADGVNITANMSFTLGGITITSWQVP